MVSTTRIATFGRNKPPGKKMIGLKTKVNFLNLEVFFLCLKSQNEECLGRGQGHFTLVLNR